MAIFHSETPIAQKSDRSAGDRTRHRQKIRESIQKNIADIISEESIIGRSSDKIIKVPVRGIKEYRFSYGDNSGGVAQGDGKGSASPGDVVGKIPKEGKSGEGEAGDEPGAEYYETEITLEELIGIMFDDLELPEMERKALRMIESQRTRKHKGNRKKGIRARLDKKKSAIARIKRRLTTDSIHGNERKIVEEIGLAIATGSDEHAKKARESIKALEKRYETHSDLISGKKRFPFHTDDLVYRHFVPKTKEESNAVVICMMDTSGSMDTMKKYLARSFFFLLFQFIKTKYQKVEIVFIAHHTEAKEVTEQEFFTKGESGGTFISSAYVKALEIIADRYHPSLWNIYAFHCSDGDNHESDNEATLKAAEKLCSVANLFGYGEIKPTNRSYESSMFEIFKKLKADNFEAVSIVKKEDVWESFRQLLTKEVTK